MAAITVTSTATPLVLGSVPIGATAAELAAVDNDNGGGAPGMVVIQNGATAIYLGRNPAVTSSTGILVNPNETFTLAVPSGRNLWAITASGTSAARVEVF